jgi:5-methylcytosine-specific restriction endonuclease McrA
MGIKGRVWKKTKYIGTSKERKIQATKAHLERNPKYQTIYKQKAKEELINLLGSQCSICGNCFHNSAYDFHHLNPKEKEFGIASLSSYKKRHEEIKKCILVCANCHRTLHSIIKEMK